MINFLKKEYIPIIIISIGAILVLFTRFLYSGDGYLAFYEDDFYYYLKVAENIVYNGFTSFDNIHRTNGYHPLWMGFIIIFIKIANGTGINFFILLNIFIFLCTIFTFKLTNKFLNILSLEREWALIISFIFIERYIAISKSGMEVILTIPLSLILMNYTLQTLNNKNRIESNSYLFIGLIISLTVLSRLDSIILVCLILIPAIIIHRNMIILNIKNLFLIIAGLLPLILYLISNIVFFQTLMPISGMAKQLRYTYYISANCLLSLLPHTPNTSIVFILLAITLMMIVSVVFKIRILKKDSSIVVFIAALFPVIFLLFLSIISGWQFWSWYMYCINISFLFISTLFLSKNEFFFKEKFKNIKKIAVICAGSYLILWCFLFSFSKKPGDNYIYADSKRIAVWINKNPGIYAMGDRAGLLGFLSLYPIVQLEGLMMDKEYLENIIQERFLNNILKEYSIDYYITMSAFKYNSNLYYTYEPYLGKLAGNKYMKGEFSDRAVLDENIEIPNYKIFKVHK
jgi:hypothetical protein